MVENYKYLEKLENTYNYLNKMYSDELEVIKRKIELEKYYYDNRETLVEKIYDYMNVDKSSIHLYKNASIRGGNYVNILENCSYKNSNNVVMFSYVYVTDIEEDKIVLYLYDREAIIYRNNKKIVSELENVEYGPIKYLVKLLDGDATNYLELHKRDSIFRWGNPEQYGLD